MTAWIMIFAIGAITVFWRSSFLVLPDRVSLPDGFQRTLRLVPAAILTALVTPAVFCPDGAMALSWENERLFAAALATLVALYTKSVLWTLVVGMGTLWVL